MKTKLISLAIFPLLAACMEAEVATDDAPEAAPAVSGASLELERAERMIDRGEDAAEAKAMVQAALDGGTLSAEERSQAAIALSRAQEVLGEEEAAVATLEAALASETDPHHPASLALRHRLRALLTGSADEPGPSFVPSEPAPSFARLLSGYFPPNRDGQISARLFIIGGDEGVSETLGTFNVGAGRRAVLEEDCPLCDHQVSVHTSRSRGDWLLFASHGDELGAAFVAVYYDLQKNRIPARYERFLPMTVAAIEAELEAGRSLLAATERPGAPPVVLLAAPRTAMLEDVEKALAGRGSLPTEPVLVEVATNLRPKEIQAVVRGDLFKPARRCYESLLTRAPDAGGRLKLSFTIAGDGAVADHAITVTEGTLDEDGFVSCVDGAVASLRFPAVGEETTVNYPIALSP